MENPFKFGTTVDCPFFTDRVKELAYVKQYVDSPNHLILISPRRFGKSSLVKKAVKETSRECIWVNMQQVTTVEDLAALLLKGIFRQHKWEKWKHLLMNFRVMPTVTASPATDEMTFIFNASVSASRNILEDTMELMEQVGGSGRRLIVVMDEFQEIMGIEKGLDKRLRAIMQEQKNINYILLGSQEPMMSDIFEKVKSPFYHFGTLMHLSAIPESDFKAYVTDRLQPILGAEAEDAATKILSITKCHPYYTQQLASGVWSIMAMNERRADIDIVRQAVEEQVEAHDLDYERLWLTLNKTDRRMMQILAKGERKPNADTAVPSSTAYSSLQKLARDGYVIRLEEYEIEDPFFAEWIRKMMQ